MNPWENTDQETELDDTANSSTPRTQPAPLQMIPTPRTQPAPFVMIPTPRTPPANFQMIPTPSAPFRMMPTPRTPPADFQMIPTPSDNFQMIPTPSIPESPTKKPKLVHPKQNLFEVVVKNSDCLAIPYELGADYIPSSSASTSAFVEETILLTDSLNHLWIIPFICFDAEGAFILTKNWAKYASTFNIQHMDTVRFMRPDPCLGSNHFIAQHFQYLPDSETVQMNFPQFLPNNFLFQMEFGLWDARFGIERLVIDAELVRQHFPGIRMNLKEEMVKFTDHRDKDWFVKMVYTAIGHSYIVMDDALEGFVTEHGLRAGDQVLFYKPNVISHDKHFFIQFTRQRQEDAPTVPVTSEHGSNNDHNRQESVAADQETVWGRPSDQSGGDTSFNISSNVEKSFNTQIARLTMKRSCSPRRCSLKKPKVVTLPEHIYPDDSVSLPSVPHELSADDLSVLHSVWEFDGGGSFDEFLKQQQQAFLLMEEINKPSQESASGTSNQKKTGPKTTGKISFNDFSLYPFTAESIQKDTLLDPKDFYEFDDSCNPEDREGQTLVFQLKISELDRLVIPDWMMSEDFPLLMIYPDREEMLQLTGNRGEIWEMSLKFDPGLQSYLITKGWSTYLKHHHLKFMDSVRCYKDVPQKNPNNFLILHNEKFGESQFLFKVVIPRSNKLRIFFDQVAGHFNFPETIPPPNHLCENTIHVIDYLDLPWEMRLVRFEEEKAYVVVRGWEQYVAKHDLKNKDMICFYRLNHKTDSNSFKIYHELSSTPGSNSSVASNEVELLPLFLPQNILCEVYLSKADFEFMSLTMTAVEIPSLCHFRNIAKLTDANNKDWFVIIEKMKEGYMIVDGWEGYTKEYKLEAGDMVKLYVPPCANHDKHFLIEYGKIKGKEKEKEEVFVVAQETEVTVQ